MKAIVILLFYAIPLIGHPGRAGAQESLEDLKPEAYFDFWLGSWDLKWKDADGGLAEGTNRIERVLDGQVIKENFKALSGELKGFTGKSYSVYNPSTNEWKQTWVDNEGAYLDFTGKFEGEKRIFIRRGKTPEGQQVLQRMVFYDIRQQSFTWDWEVSKDNGKSWQLKWRIRYKRSGTN